MTDVGLREKLVTYLREKVPSMSRDIDIYLSNNLPLLIESYDLATKGDLIDIEKRFSRLDGDVEELEVWMRDCRDRLDDINTRLSRLEKKYR